MEAFKLNRGESYNLPRLLKKTQTFLPRLGTLEVKGANSMSDTHLVQRTLRGDQSAFQALVEKYQEPVYAVVLSQIRDETQAQDLAQEPFIRAYMNLASLKDSAKFGPWIEGKTGIPMCPRCSGRSRSCVSRYRPCRPWTGVGTVGQTER